MKLPVRARNAVKSISIDFTSAMPPALVGEWDAALPSESTGPQRDAVEFIESAVSKWALYERKERVVRSAGDLQARVEMDEQVEVLGVLTASARWYREGGLAGFCQFRRTWCNNVVFDFLGVHPELLVAETREISGLGTALLYRLAIVAKELNAGLVWAETTDTSANFYARLFDLTELSDLLVIRSAEFYEPLASAIEAQQKMK